MVVPEFAMPPFLLWLFRLLATLGTLMLAPALASATDLSLSRDVYYRERIALPPGAVLTVRLIDASMPGSPVRVQARAEIPPGQVPLQFTLRFSSAQIDPTHS